MSPTAAGHYHRPRTLGEPISRRTLSAYSRSNPGGAISRVQPIRMPSLGELIDRRFLVREHLGRGGMGAVVLADDVQLGRPVAIKLLTPDLARTEALRARFLAEARAMGGVRHENVAQIYSYGTYESEPYIVMEYVPGQTVMEFMQRHRPSGTGLAMDESVGIVEQVCRGLAAIHAVGIIHGDIKPSNVLIGPGFRAVVVDFGLMRWLGDAEDMSVVVGTPAYIPPEVVQADSLDLRLTPAADVYALGVTAYEMLAGRLPFVVHTVDELFEVHLRDARAPRLSDLRPDLPVAFDEVFARVLSGDLSQRYRSADEFRRALVAARSQVATAIGTAQILIADADGDFRATTSVLLEGALPQTVARGVRDSRELARLLDLEAIDLVILDLGLPGGSAYELLQDLRASTRGASIPIVVVSQDVSATEWSTLRSMGADVCLPKPVDASTLVAVTRRLLRR